MFLTMALVFLCANGCSLSRDVKQDDPFRMLYSVDSSSPSFKKSSATESRFLTFSAKSMPLSVFSRLISDRFGIGVAFSDKLSNSSITAEFKNSDLSSVFIVLSRQLGVDFVQIGNTFYLGELKDDDRCILVRRVFSYEDLSIKNLLSSLVSSKGKADVLPGGVCVIVDSDFVIRRISDSLDSLDSVNLSSWIVQIYFLVLRKDALAEAGLSMSTSGTISYNISENELELKDFRIEGLLSGIINSSYADLYASPMLILRDGIEGNWKDGQRVPIPKKTVSDSGTVTTSGFDYINTGLQLTASVRQSRVGGYLKMNISLSDVQSYVENSPVTSETSVDIALDMLPNRIYLLSELQRFTVLDRESNTLLFSRNKGKSVIQVWGRIYRVSSPSKLDVPFVK